VADAPDLLIHWKDYAYFTKKGIDKAGQIFSSELTLDASNFPHSGTHRLDGIFLARGACIRPGQWLSGLRIVDVAPSLLYLQGAAIPNDLDGQLKTERRFAGGSWKGSQKVRQEKVSDVWFEEAGMT
jgi:predicted AlkP superfamily phosphohydrolase/phosphomutase